MNILTFDIEDWFHILDNKSTQSEIEWRNYESRVDRNTDRILEMLNKSNLKATFFCLGWIARTSPAVIRKISDAGHEVATHSDMHQLAYTQDIGQFREDLKKSIRTIEDVTGKRVISYRAPGFSLKKENRWVFNVLVEEGIEIDCSIFPASRAHGGFPSFGKEQPTLIRCDSGTIKEFPINTYKIFGRNIIFSGGGYFRLLPYSVIRYFAGKSDYMMTYFHPRDFDPEQPIIKDLTLFRRFKSYYGLSTAQNKLENLLKEVNFISLKEADGVVDWSGMDVKRV